jgi:thymidylate synthase
MLRGIVAVNKTLGIGSNGDQPFRSRLDSNVFGKYTSHSTLVCGKRTYKCMKDVNDPNRPVIEVNRHNADTVVADALEHGNVTICGGARLYERFLDRYDEFLVCWFNTEEKTDVSVADFLGCLSVRYIGTTMSLGDYHITKYVPRGCSPTKVQEVVSAAMESPYQFNKRTGHLVRMIPHPIIRIPMGIEVKAPYGEFCVVQLPADTARTQWIKGTLVEMLWMMRGRTDLAWLHERGVHVWDANYRKSRGIANDVPIPPDADIGSTYGRFWRDYHGCDQLQSLVDLMVDDPSSRRMVLQQWIPCQMRDAVLPPCVMSYTFTSVQENAYTRLDLAVMQRSSDVLTALSWNMTAAVALTAMLCATANMRISTPTRRYVPGVLTYVIANAHIYDNQESAATEYIKRPGHAYCSLAVTPRSDIGSYELEDLRVLGYQSNGPIDIGKMVV